LLKNNPLAAKLFWDSVSDMSIEKHEDHTNHDDWRSSSSDCNHTDSNKHTDTGIGVVFPPYPFND